VSIQDSPEVINEFSRQQWAVVTANVLRRSWPQDLLDDVVSAGRDEFIRLATPFLYDQDLSKKDVESIFNMLSLSAGKIPQ
jgi:hypothetical protein